MKRRGLTAMIARARRPQRTARLRLTLWYGGLFLASGAVLLAVTYALVVQAFTGNTAGNALCARPGEPSKCHVIGAGQARAMAVQQHAAVLHELLIQSAAALAVTAALSIALGWFIAARMLRPIRTITAAAREISAASLGERLALRAPDNELKELADTFDGLLARLESSFAAQRQFITNAAHELRTPLARQRVISQVALADPGATIETLSAAHERVLASGTEQQRLIDALLTLARGQAGLDQREPIDLAKVTGQVLATRQPDADRRNLTLRTALGLALAAGSPRLARQLVVNLVDNALRHNVPGGRVEITTNTVNSRAVLSVANTGPAVPAAAVNRLFQPFQRLAADRVGHGEEHGLGLAVVQAIADAHGARISARPQDTGGLQIEVTFPDPDLSRSFPHPAKPQNVAATARPDDRLTGQRSDRTRRSAGRRA